MTASARAARPRSAPLLFSCPYCRRHHLEGVVGLNTHIGRRHPGQPKLVISQVLKVETRIFGFS